MFQVGEYIVCDHNGVCRILDIAEMPELKKGVLYYELEPVYSRGSRIYAPVDSEKLVMRKVITAGEAEALLKEIPSLEAIWISNEKKREEQYRELARRYDCRDWIRIIKTIHVRKRDRRLGKEVFGVSTAQEAVEALADFIRACGLPTKLSQLKSREPVTPELLRKVADTCNLIESNPRKLSLSEVYEILMECR